jgi:methionyl-tRNA formyltransferase
MKVMDQNTSINSGEFQPGGLSGFDINALLGEQALDWANVKMGFESDPLQFEELLFKIHYKRKKPLAAVKRSVVLNFLSIGYLATDDIRYFNEFLWFYTEEESDRPMMESAMERFNSNIDEKGHHRQPAQFKNYPFTINTVDGDQANEKQNVPLRICLIGFPPFFGSMVKELKKEGHYVEQFFLPYHPSRRISQFLKLKLPVKLLSIAAANSHPYRTLNFEHKDERIGQILREGNFDVGFHKLNFIIRENIFGAFKTGLLNDHWGYLPLLRGKSTISYSVLLGMPVIPTIHFINKGIDSGPIAGYYPCDYSKEKTVKGIRDVLRKTLPARAVSAIKAAGNSSFIPKENKKEAGATFYEIHPWLEEHIASHIFKQ